MQQLSVLDLISTYREESIRDQIPEVTSLIYLKQSINQTVDSFLASVELRSILSKSDHLSNKFNDMCKEILSQDSINLESTKEAIGSIYLKIYKLDEYKGSFQKMHQVIGTIVSVLKIIRNSYSSIAISLPNEIFKKFTGDDVKTKSGKDDIINSLFYNLEGFLTTLEDSYKKTLVNNLFRIDKITDVIMRQENSIRLLVKDKNISQDIEGRLDSLSD